MGFLDLLFGKRDEKLKAALAEGAIVIDVRTPQEFKMGHVNGSINIPVDQIDAKVNKIKKYKQPIVLCCASGMRSASAVGMLHNAGLSDVYNGRTWNKVNRLLNQ